MSDNVKERKFFIRAKHVNGNVHYLEVDGHFAFEHQGFRFFARQEEIGFHQFTWVVSDCRTGIALKKPGLISPFFDDAVKLCKAFIEENFELYKKTLKKVPRVNWRPPGQHSAAEARRDREGIA